MRRRGAILGCAGCARAWRRWATWFAQACPPADAGRWPARAASEGVEADHHRRGPAVPAPDLIGRDFTAAAPNAKWCGDVTYIKTWDGWAYLATALTFIHAR